MADMLLSDCYRDVGMGTAYETGQGDSVSSAGCLVLSPCSTYTAPAQDPNSAVICLA